MNKTLAFSLILILVVSMLGFAAQVEQVDASGTIYIRDDGSIEPIDAPITSFDNVTYTFTSNTSASIVVERSNIIINGSSCVVQGNGTATAGNGFTLSSVSNVTIINVNIKGFGFGIYVQSGSANKIIANNLTNSNYAFGLFSSSSNNLSANNMINNKYSFFISGSTLTHFVHLIDSSNLVDSKPVYYLVSRNNLVINSTTHPQIGFLALIDCDNATVEGLALTSKWQALMLAYTSNSRIRDNNMKSNYYALWLYSSSDNAISRNNSTSNEISISADHSSRNNVTANNLTSNKIGVQLLSSPNNSILGNNITKSSVSGLSLSDSSNSNNIHGNNLMDNKNSIALDLSSNHNTISSNNITLSTVSGIEIYESSDNNVVSGNHLKNNTVSIEVFSSAGNNISDNNITKNSDYGIFFDSSDSNIIYGNSLTDNDVSISLDTSNSNSISVNNLTENQVGIQMYESSNNKIFHNSFANNTVRQVDLFTSGYTNVWDDGYPSGGNNWSDYTGVDANADGIGDTPYVIDADNQDRYPLMKPYVPPIQPPPDTTPPTISVISPENKTYNARGIPLTFTLSEQASWIGYSLDDQANFTINGNTTITGLPNGTHNVRIYANDTAGNMGFSDAVSFTIQVTSNDTTPPSISIASPENTTYTTANIPLSFTANEPTQWIGYSLDNQSNITVTGNTTLAGLADGPHSIIVYALDTVGNAGASGKRYFTVEITQPPPPETNPPFPLIWGVVILVAIVAGTAVGLVYFKKIRKRSKKAD